MTIVLTFEQPLYWKAMGIELIKSSNSQVKICVLRLDRFHICMSILGTIGHMMQESRLTPIFDIIYAESTVPDIVRKKAVSGTKRAHLILYTCLVGVKVST